MQNPAVFEMGVETQSSSICGFFLYDSQGDFVALKGKSMSNANR